MSGLGSVGGHVAEDLSRLDDTGESFSLCVVLERLRPAVLRVEDVFSCGLGV